MPRERVYKPYELRKIPNVLEYLKIPLVQSYLSSKYGSEGYKVLLDFFASK
jgi:hypothetical protein